MLEAALKSAKWIISGRQIFVYTNTLPLLLIVVNQAASLALEAPYACHPESQGICQDPQKPAASQYCMNCIWVHRPVIMLFSQCREQKKKGGVTPICVWVGAGGWARAEMPTFL